MEVKPHYLRFAIAIAMAGAPGCYQAHERDVDAAVDAFVPPSIDMGLCARPLPCTCPTLAMGGTCDEAHAICCPITGPLAPPSIESEGRSHIAIGP